MKIAQYGTTIVVMHAIVHVGDLVNDFAARFRELLTTADSTITS